MMAFCRGVGFLWWFLFVNNVRFSILVQARSHPSWHLGGSRNGSGRFEGYAPSLAPTGDPPAPSKYFKKSKKKRKTELSDEEQTMVRATKSGKEMKPRKKTSRRPRHAPDLVVNEEIASQAEFHQSMPKSHKRIKKSKKHTDGDQQHQYPSSKREIKPPQSQAKPDQTSDFSVERKRKHKQSKKGKKRRSRVSDRHADTSPQVNEIKTAKKRIKRTKRKTSSWSPVMNQTKPTFISPNDHTLPPTERVEYAEDKEELYAPFESTDETTSVILVGSSRARASSPGPTTLPELDGTDDQALMAQEDQAMTNTDGSSIDDKQADFATAPHHRRIESVSPSTARDEEPIYNETLGCQNVSLAHADIDADDAGVDVAAPAPAPGADEGGVDHVEADVTADIHTNPSNATSLHGTMGSDDTSHINHSSFVEGVTHVLDVPQDEDEFIARITSIEPETRTDHGARDEGAPEIGNWERQRSEEDDEYLTVNSSIVLPTATNNNATVDHPLSHLANSEDELRDSADNFATSINNGISANVSETTRSVTPDDAAREDDELEQGSPNDVASLIDPQDPYLEPDVVQFIGQILKEEAEEVRGWTCDETSSSTENGSLTTSLNETRGGSQFSVDRDIDNNAVGIASHTVPDPSYSSTEGKITTGPESPCANPQGNESTVEVIVESTDGASVVGARPLLDRSSLEVSEDKDTDAVVSIVTWNLAEESPSESDALFIRSFRGSDLVLISGQECENIKPRRAEGRRSREYRRLMITMLGKEYIPIALHLLGGIQFGLFAKKSFLKQIEHVSVADVTCGIGNVFHNKGAIAAFLQVKARNSASDNHGTISRSKSVRMMFITAHMAAHVKNSDARDADFWRISSELEAQAPDNFPPLQRSDSPSHDRSFLVDSVDRAFFCGDLNYRIDLPREVVEGTILSIDEERVCGDLLKHDQLLRTMTEGRAFPGFAEGKIKFAPTFKFDKETREYDTSHKQRIPAWTDRVLFKPWGTRVISYDSVSGAQHSDHRPVYATFRVNLEGRELQPKGKRRTKGVDEDRKWKGPN